MPRPKPTKAQPKPGLLSPARPSTSLRIPYQNICWIQKILYGNCSPCEPTSLWLDAPVDRSHSDVQNDDTNCSRDGRHMLQCQEQVSSGSNLSFSVSSTFTIELAKESVTSELAQLRDVTGAQQTLYSGFSSSCMMLLVSFQWREFGFETDESFRKGLASASLSLEPSGRDGV